ncbi:MAG: pitrilysin family protein [Candidatus Melainabacteria bacterium]|nr:pitrilysin family protein [Candidatus Melainabacteria bacterium]
MPVFNAFSQWQPLLPSSLKSSRPSWWKKPLLAVTLIGLVAQNPVCTPQALWANAQTAPATAPSQINRPPQGSGPIQVVTLANGHQIFIHENHSQPIVTIDTWVATGSIHETPENNGVSHFLEHLLFKGTRTRPAGALERFLDARGASFNAATSQDFTHYHITIASPFFNEALDYHADMLQRASIPADELDRERLVVQEEINRAQDTPQRQLFRELSTRLYGPQGYGLDTLGPKETIASISREAILNYYHYWYQPQHFKTVISGHVTAPEAVQAVRKAFSSFPESTGTYQPPTGTQAPKYPQAQQVKVLSSPKVSQAYAILAFPAPGMNRKHDTYPLDVAMHAFGGGQSSRLYQRLREKEGVVTDIQAGNLTQAQGGMLYVLFQTQPDQLQSALNSVLEELQTLQRDGLRLDEIKKTKTQFVKEYIFQHETTADVAEGIGHSVTIGQLEDYTDYPQRVQAVNASAIQQALAQYGNPQQAVLVVLLPEKATEKPVFKQKNGLSTTHRPAFISASTLEAQLKERLSHLLIKPEDAIARQQTPRRPSAPTSLPTAERRVLSNGLTLLSRPLPQSNTVAITVFARGGHLVEAQPGVADLTARLMSTETRNRNAQQLAQVLESKGMKLSVSADADVVQITAGAVTEDLGELLLILKDVLQSPRFDKARLEKEKALLAQELQAHRDNPSALVFENLMLKLYHGHPYSHVGQHLENHLGGITTDMLESYYQQWFEPKNLVVTAVGNVDAADLASSLESFWQPKVDTPTERGSAGTNSTNTGHSSETLASLKSTAPWPAPTALKEPEISLMEKPQQAATWIARGWLAPKLNETGYFPLKVLNSLLGGGMSSRLFVNLREKQGLAYAVGSLYPSRMDNSHFVLYIGSDPKNQAAILKGFDQEIARILADDITEEELNRAKDNVVGTFALAHETPANQAFYLGFYEALGAGYQLDSQYAERVQAVTRAEVISAAQLLYGQPSVTAIVAPPAPAASLGKDQPK